jgi:DNA-binding transcriptional MerR regulator
MKDMFLVGELAKLFHISTDTLRHYDRIGLLKPEYDASNHYRYYSVRQFFQLSRILFFKSIDLSLKDISKYMRHKNTQNLIALLKEKEEEMDSKIQRYTNLKNKIVAKRDLLESVENELNTILVKRYPRRIGVLLDMMTVEKESDFKQVLKKSGRFMQGSSWLVEGQIYTSVSQNHLLSGEFKRFRYFVEFSMMDVVDDENVLILPEQEYVCMSFRGPYRQMVERYSELMQWINENGFVVNGDSIEKNIVDYDYSDSESEYISEIQIPVALK